MKTETYKIDELRLNKKSYEDFKKELKSGIDFLIEMKPFIKNRIVYSFDIYIFYLPLDRYPNETYGLLIYIWNSKYPGDRECGRACGGLNKRLEFNTFEELVAYLDKNKFLMKEDFVKGKIPKIKSKKYSIKELFDFLDKNKVISISRISKENLREYQIHFVIRKNKLNKYSLYSSKIETEDDSEKKKFFIKRKYFSDLKEIPIYLEKRKFINKKNWTR